MKTSNRYIIDVTQLVNWKGRLTGIPRVMNELSDRFSEDIDPIFISWDGFSGKFEEVDLKAALDARNSIHSDEAVATAGYKIRLINITKRIIKTLRRKSRIARVLTNVPIRFSKKLLSLRRKEIQNNDQLVSKKPAFTFNQKDTLVVFWGEWADEQYIKALINAHEEKVSIVQFVHDMLPVVTPQYSGHSTESLTRYSLAVYPICSLLLSISEHTKKDVIDWLKQNKVDVPKISVIRLGDDFSFATAKKPKNTNLLKRNYILCVGTIEARKNHCLLYYVYKQASQRGIELPQLAVVGRRGWRTDDVYDLIRTDPQTNEKIIFFEDCDDNELSWLYEHCKFSVYPSFYEGWGLPIAESVARGVPCISSNTSSMPEVAQDLISYFDPTSVDQCLKQIQTLMEPKQLEKHREACQRYNPTTWDQTYTQVKSNIESKISL